VAISYLVFLLVVQTKTSLGEVMALSRARSLTSKGVPIDSSLVKMLSNSIEASTVKAVVRNRNSYKQPRGEPPSVYGVFLAVMFVIEIPLLISITVLLFWQIMLIGRNRTTIEYYEFDEAEKGKKKNFPYDLGYLENFREIFGNSMWLWFLPISNTTGNGLQFRVSESFLSDLHNRNLLNQEEGRVQVI